MSEELRSRELGGQGVAASAAMKQASYCVLHCLWNEGDQREPGFPGWNARKCPTIKPGTNSPQSKWGNRGVCPGYPISFGILIYMTDGT